MNKKKKIIALLVAIAAAGAITFGTSYAYFTSQVEQNAQATVITSGCMSLKYIDGDAVELVNALPGSEVTKEFSVQNTCTLTTNYNVYFKDVINGFTGNDLVYTLKKNGTVVTTRAVVPTSEDVFLQNQTINPNDTDTYELKIEFLETGVNQDINQGVKYKSKVNISAGNLTLDPNTYVAEAEDFTYTNEANPQVTNVSQALDDLYNRLRG